MISVECPVVFGITGYFMSANGVKMSTPETGLTYYSAEQGADRMSAVHKCGVIPTVEIIQDKSSRICRALIFEGDTSEYHCSDLLRAVF